VSRPQETEARQLGYVLDVSEAPNMPPPMAYMVYAAPYVVGQATVGRFLCYTPTAADAAETGLEIVRGVVDRSEPWPEHP
jgi:hypothetical protein